MSTRFTAIEAFSYPDPLKVGAETRIGEGYECDEHDPAFRARPRAFRRLSARDLAHRAGPSQSPSHPYPARDAFPPLRSAKAEWPEVRVSEDAWERLADALTWAGYERAAWLIGPRLQSDDEAVLITEIRLGAIDDGGPNHVSLPHAEMLAVRRELPAELVIVGDAHSHPYAAGAGSPSSADMAAWESAMRSLHLRRYVGMICTDDGGWNEPVSPHSWLLRLDESDTVTHRITATRAAESDERIGWHARRSERAERDRKGQEEFLAWLKQA